MTRKTDARENAIAAAIRLFRLQGYTATGLTQILEESGAPKGSFYFHFPKGKVQLAEEAIDRYVAQRIAVIQAVSAETTGDALGFTQRLIGSFAADMKASDFRYGCLMQNLANELPALDADLTQRVAQGFATSTEIIRRHFEGCGLSGGKARSAAAALVASLEGARTVARLERSPAVFEALSEMAAQQWAA
ncbi:TetR/AcrR family transcriptional regulator [Devosia sp. BK]|jgi:AcrR family transcriptional regulator|uniref:TetR/AcrR family transcriptional regulator n=1 Tax=unclassified Devosia TaxID=196773 RepID=UPI00071300F9|nr:MULTISPECIES: TetR/AcrR family transcriptional regulator [unclassified Devosia]KQN74927.1 TetR family transcriptional regulator [Devosia sp. Leaf64]KQT42757.1 TetR family transcriptional regulator [Devosia sp. Leaf420]MDV3253269.1 TetR/AcrR family transcriptional regulator [Devosia sp. BK]